MFEENIGLAYHIAYKYYTLYKHDLRLSNEDLEDMKQEALEELWVCQARYKSGKFSSYGGRCVEGRMKSYIDNKFKPKAYTDFKDYYEEEFYCDYIEKAEDMEDIIKEYEKYIQLKQISEALDQIQVDGKRYIYNKRYAKSNIGKYAFTLALEGLTEVEIANALNSDRSNVRKAINKTIERIKYILEESA